MGGTGGSYRGAYEPSYNSEWNSGAETRRREREEGEHKQKLIEYGELLRQARIRGGRWPIKLLQVLKKEGVPDEELVGANIGFTIKELLADGWAVKRLIDLFDRDDFLAEGLTPAALQKKGIPLATLLQVFYLEDLQKDAVELDPDKLTPEELLLVLAKKDSREKPG